jgi:hypothetical protein
VFKKVPTRAETGKQRAISTGYVARDLDVKSMDWLRMITAIKHNYTLMRLHVLLAPATESAYNMHYQFQSRFSSLLSPESALQYNHSTQNEITQY